MYHPMEEEEHKRLESLIGELVIIRPRGIYKSFKIDRPWIELTTHPGILIKCKSVPNIDNTPSLNNYWGIWNGEKIVWIPTTMYEPHRWEP